MSVEAWSLEKDLCRCCHAKGSFDNLAEPKTHSEKEEIYSDMIRDCFDIEISPIPGDLCAMTYKICDACILRVREAFSFKKQVQECESKFMELYYENTSKALKNYNTESLVKEQNVRFHIEFKEEVDELLEKHNHNINDDYFVDCDDEQNSDEEPLKKKRPKISEKCVQKPKQQRGRPPQNKEREHDKDKEKEHEKDKEKEKKGEKPKFRLRPGDYTHDGDKYSCSKCDKSYDSLGSIRSHIKTKHYKIPRFTCPYCMKGFITMPPLTIHKLQDHNIDERFHCKACKGTFNSKITLKKHINNYHMLGEKFKCELCDYESFSFEGLYKHKFKHRTSKDFHCRFCKKSFLRKTTLALHERIHTGDRRKVCKVCSQAFVQKASLNYHMTKYHPDVNY